MLAACAVPLVGCGDDGDEPAATTTTAAAVDLHVTVRPEGADGPARERMIQCARLGAGDCRELAGLRVADLAPVAADVVCAQLFGGPATATVEGTLRGERVDVRFALTDSCEIERWRRNAAVLGAPPGNPPG